MVNVLLTKLLQALNLIKKQSTKDYILLRMNQPKLPKH